MYGIWINIQRMESWHEGFIFFTLSWRLPVSATPASTSLLITHSVVFSIHPLMCPLVLCRPLLSVLVPGWAVRLRRLCQMRKQQENQHLPSLMLLLLPAGSRTGCVNPGQRDWRLSSGGHSSPWSVLQVPLHLLATAALKLLLNHTHQGRVICFVTLLFIFFLYRGAAKAQDSAARQ